MNRPCEQRSRVAAVLASMNGLRYGATDRWVSSLIRSVTAAANASPTKGSRVWCPPCASQLAPGMGCSVSANASNPAASTATATSLISPESSRSDSRPEVSG